MEQDNNNKVYGYKFSFFVAAELLIVSFALEIITGAKGLKPLTFPVNLLVFLGFVVVLVSLHVAFGHKVFVRWLSGIPAAISAVSLVALLVLLMGFIPQANPTSPFIVKALGFDHVKTSYALALAQVYLLTSLGLVAIRRATPLNLRNVGFLFNHVGLWLVLAAASLGVGDMQRVLIELHESTPAVNKAINNESQVVSLPFSLRLLDFQMDEHPAKLVIYDVLKQRVLTLKKNTVVAQAGSKGWIDQWYVEVTEAVASSKKVDSIYVGDTLPGACQAVFVKVSDKKGRTVSTGWLCCGSFSMPFQSLLLNEKYHLFLSKPEARRFSSNIEITSNGKTMPSTLEVNHPVKVAGWKLYQYSYDQDKGRWSKISIIEAVRDLWLVVVYIGIAMLLVGAVYLFWIGKE